MRTPSRAGPRDDVGAAVTVDVAGRHVDPAAEAGIRVEVGQHRPVGAADDPDVRAAAGVAARDEVVPAVAIDVAEGRSILHELGKIADSG